MSILCRVFYQIRTDIQKPYLNKGRNQVFLFVRSGKSFFHVWSLAAQTSKWGQENVQWNVGLFRSFGKIFVPFVVWSWNNKKEPWPSRHIKCWCLSDGPRFSTVYCHSLSNISLISKSFSGFTSVDIHTHLIHFFKLYRLKSMSCYWVHSVNLYFS